MKKLLFAFPIVALLAAGCNSSLPVVENQQNNSQGTQTQQTTPAPTPTPTATASWKDTVLSEFNNLTDWQESNPSDWQFADYTNETQHRSQLKKFLTGQIILLSKSFNGKGCQSDCTAEGDKQNNLLTSVKTSLSQNGWSPVSWPTEPGFYTDYLYIKDKHPLILQVGTRDAVSGGMYVSIEFQY